MTMSMTGKICLVTGATAGIGAATALGLAQSGATVVILGRSAAKCQATVQHIQQQVPGAQVDYLQADLAAQADIRRATGEYAQRYAGLDVLINNAGINQIERQVSPDGIELVLATNHLSYFLLTHLLLDRLKARAPARIINVSSFVHSRAKINFENLQAGGLSAYPQSKLANLLFTYELARRLDGSGVTVNALNPGLVRSAFGLNLPGPSALIKRVLNAVRGISPEEGAQTSLYLATSPEVAGVTGMYFEKCKPIQSSAAARSRADAQRLWDLSAQLTGLPANGSR